MKFAGAVGSSTVVVPNVDCEHHTQVPLVEDQHAVSEFGSDSADEPFGETVRLRTPGRNSDPWMPTSARTASNDAANWPARSRTKNRNSVTRSPRSITRFRICWVVHRPSGLVVVPNRCTDRLGTSKTNNT